MREALSLLIPACAIGVFVLPRSGGWARSSVFAATLSLCLGIGFSSVIATALIVGGVAPAGPGFVLADLTIWIIVAAIGWRMREPKTRTPEREAESLEPVDRLDWIVRAAFGVAATIALISAIVSSHRSPHGDWDAWAIWNQHARFLFRGGSDGWRALLAINWSQPDYPLLLPASVARVWAYAGHESTLGPTLIAIVLGMASVTLVVTALGGRRGWIAGALILVANPFLTQVPSQCADVPLACFIVATLAVASGAPILDPKSRIPAVIAGATSALAAWTKNEGLVFALLMLLVAMAVAVRRREGRQLLWGMAGAVPALIAIVWFKLTLAPTSGLVEGQSLNDLVVRLIDLHRHRTVAVLMAEHAVRWSAPFAVAVFPLVALVAAWRAVRDRGAVRMVTVVLALMLASYYLVYVTTPFDISWHVSTSIDRLLIQLWPSLVLAVFLLSPLKKP
jgi:hypothetical protein